MEIREKWLFRSILVMYNFFFKSIWTFGRTKRKWTIFCKVFYIEYGTEPWYIHDINVSLVVLQEVVNRTCFVLLQSTYSITGNETIWKLCHLPMLMYVTFILIYADRICTWIYLLMHVSSDAMKMFSHRKKREKRDKINQDSYLEFLKDDFVILGTCKRWK